MLLLPILIPCLQTALGFTINFPTGFSTNYIAVSALTGNSSVNRVADVLLTDGYTSFTDAQKSTIANFLKQQDGGLVMGGQAW